MCESCEITRIYIILILPLITGIDDLYEERVLTKYGADAAGYRLGDRTVRQCV